MPDIHPQPPALGHRHGWDCFRTSGGYTNAMDTSTPLAERVEGIYKTAYRTGKKNGAAYWKRLYAEIAPNLKTYEDACAGEPND